MPDARFTPELAQAVSIAMLDPARARAGQLPVDAGYTYVGQMISHDIVANTNRYTASRRVSGVLDLESLYGSDPYYNFSHPGDNHLLLNRDGKFRLNSGHDLPRNGTRAVIPEQRNDENIIVAQLHSFWLRLHNYLITNGYAGDGLEARKIITLLFQLVVVEDFLPRILQTRVHQQCFLENKRFLSIDGIPQFFSLASFRFGHSVIRQSYKLKTASYALSLDELFQIRPIAPDRALDWSMFFATAANSVQGMLPLDTHISAPMGRIPGDNVEPAMNIALLNIMAGLNVGLPSGIELIESLLSENPAIANLDIEPLRDVANATFSDVAGISIETLPLWLYILLEAQVQENGQTLGVLGSVLNAEVLRHSMASAQYSVYRNNAYNRDEVLARIGAFGDKLDFSTAGNDRETGASIMASLIAISTEEES
jgi:hypothetical protein